MNYDYKNAKKRIYDALTSKTDINRELQCIPEDESKFTYKNGIKTWVGALFIDIVGSSKLFRDEKDEKVARIMRTFCDELIRILSQNQNHRQIGIRGDCVYAIYDAPLIPCVESIFDDAILINTFIKMFRKILKFNQFPDIQIGIGLGLSETLIIKAGQKGTGINDNIWIGRSVVNASNLSSEATRNYKKPILLDSLFYQNLKSYINKNPHWASWFQQTYSNKLSEYVYGIDLIYIEFNNWIENEL